ncbi:Sas10/Utp3/C1D family-domain-containing protein [Podospora didyma]|uniref:Exosome complex protein n=1 Tax=Podospora didyma TaxID=330526 RepID=A0AAE0P625_9PEZI|nr:Sas10/Utp3/C1D family-domain-containing protein [Podospora didyma]
MDVSDITPALGKLDTDLDELRDALKPLLGDIADVSSKLPLLDKAKLYVLVSYAIESLLFSALRLNEVETKNHAIFSELTRVKQYFDKIQKLEVPMQERDTTVNVEASARIIKFDLSGNNKKITDKLNELIAKERAKAEQKAAEKKRPADESTLKGVAQTGENLSKRQKSGSSKKRK